MKTTEKIGKMDATDWTVIGIIGVIALTGIVLIGRQIKKLIDRKRVLLAQHTNPLHPGTKPLQISFSGDRLICDGCANKLSCVGFESVDGLNCSGFFKAKKENVEIASENSEEEFSTNKDIY